MTRTHLACYGLGASAFVLAGLLVISFRGGWTPQAQASLIVNRDAISLLTAKTRADEEALFVLDGSNDKLLIYRLELAKNQLELAESIDLNLLFAGGGQGGAGPGRGR